MFNRKIRYLLVLTPLLVLLVLPLVAQAEILNGAGLGALTGTGLPTTAPGVLIGQIISWLLGLIGVILIALIVYGGVLYMTAAGNEEQADKAKKILTYSVVGVAIVVVAWIVADYVLSALLS